MYAVKSWYTNLHILLIVILCLLVMGSLFVYSASSVYALEVFGTADYFLKKHIFGIILGSSVLCIASLVPLPLIKKTIPLIFFGSLILTFLTLTPMGQKVHGAQRWLHILFITFQPSELLKVAFVLFLSQFLEKTTHKNTQTVRNFLFLFFTVALMSIVLLKQPDFGLTITLLATTLLMLFVAQYRLLHLIIISCLSIPVVGILIAIKPYRMQRIATFLNPWQDPQGSGFQLIQSLIAIGSGGTWGTGIAHSKQKFFYLPMQHTDFIFSIIAEETGFIGTSFLIFLYILFLFFGIRLANQMRSLFSFFVTIGFVSLVMLQVSINLAVTTGLMPTKGLGLPFISYGNTSLVCTLFFFGVIINTVRNEKISYTAHITA